MASSRKATVILSSTDADTVVGPVVIKSILYMPGSGSGATIKADDGTIIWDTGASATARIYDSNVDIRETGTLTINFSGSGAKLYLYTKLE